MSEAPIPKLTPEERAELRGKLQFAAVLGVDPFASIPVQSRKLAALLDENERHRAEKDAAYSERNRLVVALAKLALARGWRAGVRGHEPDPDPTWDDDWKNVVLIDLPCGQVSWHFHDSERPLLAGLPRYAGRWDGHSNEQKWERVASLEMDRAGSDSVKGAP